MATISLRQEKIKTREGDRLKRSLRSLFGGLDFGFLWVDDSTSYTDGKTIFVKYDIQTPQHRVFSPEECRVLRKAHGLHERGHIEFDCLDDYRQWIKELSSNQLSDWKDFAKKKYPPFWVEFFGNMALDGRMENMVVLKLPNFKDYVDFCNYEWRFGIRGEGIGENPVFDFQNCYSSRVLGMTDLDDWLPESLELVDSVQGKIEELRISDSTKKCLNIVTDIMEQVWPTIAEWLDLNNMEMDNPPAADHLDNHDFSKQWGNSKETAENAQKVLVRIVKENDENSTTEPSGTDNSGDLDTSNDSPEGNSNEQDTSNDSPKGKSDEQDTSNDSSKGKSDEQDSSEAPEKPDFTLIVRLEEKQLNKDETEVDQEIQDFASRIEEIEIEIPEKKKTNNENVKVQAYKRKELDQYQPIFTEVKRFVKPVSKALKALLEEESNSVRKNVRSGRFMPNKAWKAVHCDDTNVFSKKQSGTPKGEAFISLLADISGSTFCRLSNGSAVIQEIKKSLSLILEACKEANLPSTAYAFTEYDDDTFIYPIKPNPARYDEEEKGYLGALIPEYGNRDPLALQWAINQISLQKEEIRLLIILSDGLPHFGDEEGPETIRHMVEKAEKSGIDVLCLFVGSPEKHVLDLVKSMYPGRAIFADKDISKELNKQVKRIIRQRRS